MATSLQKPTTTPSSSTQSCFDPLDIDRYIDYDQNLFPSPSNSPVSSRSKPSTSPSTAAATLATSPFSNQQSQQIFPPPNHQYDAYHQQAGLAPGALANTVAVNQADHLSFGGRAQSFFPMPSFDGLFGMNSTDDVLDFGTVPSRNPSVGGADMELDFGSPTQDMFMHGMGSSSTDFIDPAAIGGQEDNSNVIPAAPATVGRVWPGMHQQQAALKAQAQQQSQQQAAAQPVRTLAASQPRQPNHRSTGSTSRPPTDPVVEERISRLLNQMRHSSVASSNDDDAATPTASGSGPHSGRMKKEEEDMDEDERLLASEEGKKLSSKERRQLRNKVSARAFRSRRKEYIGQLEGEIAAKAAEADDLRAKNSDLIAENTRLTDLTRMLLASPAFSTFLNDLSGSVPSSSAPAQASSSPGQTPTMKTEQIPSRPHKDVNPHQATRQQARNSQPNDQQVGMILMPEPSADYTAFDTNNPGWTDNNMDFSLYDAQVFAVTEIPEGPSFDQLNSDILSGKSSNIVGPYAANKDEIPVIELMPSLPSEAENVIEANESNDDIEFDESDPAFALFADSLSTSQPTPLEPQEQIFGSIGVEKAFGRVELVLEDDLCDDEQVSSATMERFQRLCSIMEAASERISAVTSHL